MITESAADANRSFSKLLREVAKGESVTVLSHGRPVATLSPAQDQSREKQHSRTALLKRLSLEPVTDQQRSWTRDELYD
jgi:prevent-host-death family protein